MVNVTTAPITMPDPAAWRAIVTKVLVNVVAAGAIYANTKWGIQLDVETQGLVVAVLFAGANALAHWVIAKIPALAPQPAA